MYREECQWPPSEHMIMRMMHGLIMSLAPRGSIHLRGLENSMNQFLTLKLTSPPHTQNSMAESAIHMAHGADAFTYTKADNVKMLLKLIADGSYQGINQRSYYFASMFDPNEVLLNVEFK